MKELDALHARSPIREYMNWISHTGDDALYQEKYAAIVAAQETEKPCFITVVIRTQGKRIDMLQDVFLSLQAQLDQDFEVVIICHRAEKQAYEAVCRTVAQQGEAFAAKVRCIASNEGERGAPINLGFAHARGEYAVCLDDDDLVLDHWIACFHEAAQTQRGKILHAYVVTQPWKVFLRDERQQLMAEGKPGHEYCVPYDTIRQQSTNRCPFMGLAFPLFLFRDMHILFDEHITTTEDWDYLLRTAGITGVHDITEPTAIYRLWNAQDASRQLHQHEEWKENYRRIGQRLSDAPLIIPVSEAANYRSMLMGLKDDEADKGRASFLNVAILFWSDGSAFTDHCHVTARVGYGKGKMRAIFDLPPEEDRTNIRRLRFDPAKAGMFSLEAVSVKLIYDSGETVALSMENLIASNGVIEGDSICFLTGDPMLTFRVEPRGALRQVCVYGTLSFECPQMVQRFISEICADANWLAENTNRARLYLDTGRDYNDEQCILCDTVYRGQDYHASFTLSQEQSAGLRGLRFDPTEAGMVWLDGLQIRLTYADGRQTDVSPLDCGWFNGFVTPTGVAFIDSNPYMFLPVDASAQLVQAEVRAKIEFVDLKQMELLFSQAASVPDYALICAQLDKLRRKQ